VDPVEYGQHLRHRALHAERHPGETTRPQLGEVTRVDRLRVGLGGDLGAVGQPELGVDRAQDRDQVGGREQRRRAAAEEHGLHPNRTEHPAGQPNLVDHRPRVVLATRSTAELSGGVGVEVAIAAAGGAVRHMHVDPERLCADAYAGRRRKHAVQRRRITIG
jgi:hypothetical protein